MSFIALIFYNKLKYNYLKFMRKKNISSNKFNGIKSVKTFYLKQISGSCWINHSFCLNKNKLPSYNESPFEYK